MYLKATGKARLRCVFVRLALFLIWAVIEIPVFSNDVWRNGLLPAKNDTCRHTYVI